MGRLAVEGSGRLLGRTYHLWVFRVSAEHQAYESLGAQDGCGKSGMSIFAWIEHRERAIRPCREIWAPIAEKAAKRGVQIMRLRARTQSSRDYRICTTARRIRWICSFRLATVEVHVEALRSERRQSDGAGSCCWCCEVRLLTPPPSSIVQVTWLISMQEQRTHVAAIPHEVRRAT